MLLNVGLLNRVPEMPNGTVLIRKVRKLGRQCLSREAEIASSTYLCIEISVGSTPQNLRWIVDIPIPTSLVDLVRSPVIVSHSLMTEEIHSRFLLSLLSLLLSIDHRAISPRLQAYFCTYIEYSDPRQTMISLMITRRVHPYTNYAARMYVLPHRSLECPSVPQAHSCMLQEMSSERRHFTAHMLHGQK